MGVVVAICFVLPRLVRTRPAYAGCVCSSRALCDPGRVASRVLPASSLCFHAPHGPHMLFASFPRGSIVHPLDSFYTLLVRPLTTPMPFLFAPSTPRICINSVWTVSLTRTSHRLVYPYVPSYLATL
ncbi:hypothetical protein K523DRAFT_321202 [Schizophyllum commune Tattone D]|nr:hypothetical protein K523DRAFT_321202 [Schizophyllum commune Tattone D]